MSYHNQNMNSGFESSSKSSKPKRGAVHTYINADGDLVQEGSGEFLGARLAGGEAFISDSEEDDYEPTSSPERSNGFVEKKKKKSKKSSSGEGSREYSLGGYEPSSGSKKKRSKERLEDSVPRGHAAPAGGCCAGCSHGQPMQQPMQQPMHQQYHAAPMAIPSGGPAPQQFYGAPGYPSHGPAPSNFNNGHHHY